MSSFDTLLSPYRLKHLLLRNRVLSTGHASGLAESGMPGEVYQYYHEEKAKGGIGLTIFGGSSSVAPDSPLAFNQIDMSHDRVLPYLEQMSDRVHRHGAAIFCQITHLGRRGNWRNEHWLPMVGPSASREIAHRSFAKEMEDFDFRRIIKAFADAAERGRKGGLDGIEVMAAAHHLIDSFLSPVVNQRTDSYGGSLENRMRFGLEVLGAIRERVGNDFIVGLRLSGDELIEGGLDAGECLKVASHFGKSGLIDYLSIYQAHGDTFAGLAAMLPDMTFPPAAFLYLASAVKAEVDIPIIHASAIRDVATASRAIEDGHVDLVAMTRAHIADPHIVKKLQDNRLDDIRQCVGANYCVDHAGQGGLCIQNAATGREKHLPHILSKAPHARRIVVAGGGPGGLEAARAAAERGHRVTLFESSALLGGQVNLAKSVPQRESMSGIVRWLEHQVRKKGVEIRLNTPATADAVLAENPDVVFVATGGIPHRPTFAGADLTVSSWSILSGEVQAGSNVLVYDEVGLPAGIGCVDFLASRGCTVEMVTADRMVAEEVGATLHVGYVRNLYQNNVIMSPNMQLVGAYQEGNALIAILRNAYTGSEEERSVDQIVHELGTSPDQSLYQALRPHSSNLGEVDYEALIDDRAQNVRTNPNGDFALFRIGDALFSRNIHAAIYDAGRLVKDL